MRKLILALFVLSIPFAADAQRVGLLGRKKMKMEQDLTAYMQGAVPEVDGKVVFTTTIAAPGKTAEQLFPIVAQWANLRYMPNTENGIWNDPDYYFNKDNASVKTADKAKGLFVCQGDEEQVFSNRTLAKDYCIMNYTLTIQLGEGSVTATMSNISYVYTLSETPERIAAEDWITDSEAFNRKGTKMLKGSGKFRIKTVDLKNQLFKEIGEAVSK